MENGKKHLSAPYLFMLTAAAGIFMFISAWNSFIQGKEKMYISILCLVLFLTGLIALYFRFTRLASEHKANVAPDALSPNKVPSATEKTNYDTEKRKETVSGLLKGAFSGNNLKISGDKILRNLAQEFEIVQGVFFVLNQETLHFTFVASYALNIENVPPDFVSGEGISGQAVTDGRILIIPNLPDSYSPVISGLGKAKPRFLYVIPLIHEKICVAVIEISCFKEIEENRISLLHQLMREGGAKLATVLSPETK
jgi:hypothetical protein